MTIALVALLSLLLAVELGGRVIDGVRLARQLEPPALLTRTDLDEVAEGLVERLGPLLVAPPVHRVELTAADGRAIAVQGDHPLDRESMRRLEVQFDNRVGLNADPLAELVAHRYVVTLPDESTFGAVMVDTKTITTPAGRPELVFMFEQCQTMPKHEGDTPETIAGRVILWSSGIAYLQRVS